jgi:hypothetical protein
VAVLFNVDENISSVIRAAFVEDFREVHASCWLIFSHARLLDFRMGETVVFLGLEWEAVTYKRIKQGENYVYSVMGYPKAACTLVRSGYRTLSEMAMGLNIKLFPDSVDCIFKFPARNVYLGPLLYKYRFQSFEENRDNPGRAVFIFYDQRGLVCIPYDSISSTGYGDFAPRSMALGYSFVRDDLLSDYRAGSQPSRIRYKGWMQKIVGDKVEVQGNVAGAIGRQYALHTGEEDLDGLSGMVLVRQSLDTAKQPRPWNLVFGRLLL